MSFTDDAVDLIMMRLTDVAPGDDPDAQSFLQDTFTRLVRAITTHVGEPTGRRLGGQPEVRWRRAHTTILLENVCVAINLTWATNRWQDYWDALGEERA